MKEESVLLTSVLTTLSSSRTQDLSITTEDDILGDHRTRQDRQEPNRLHTD